MTSKLSEGQGRETVTIGGRQFRVANSFVAPAITPPHPPVPASKKPSKNRTRVHRVVVKPLDGEARPRGALWLSMPPPSLNNLFVNSKHKGRFKSATYKTWQGKAFKQLRKQGSWHVPGAIKVRIVLNRKETGADLDNMIKPTLDLLMAAGRIADDRNVVEVCAVFEQSATGTRIEIERAA